MASAARLSWIIGWIGTGGALRAAIWRGALAMREPNATTSFKKCEFLISSANSFQERHIK
jgi:hypothetical protein